MPELQQRRHSFGSLKGGARELKIGRFAPKICNRIGIMRGIASDHHLRQVRPGCVGGRQGG